MKKLIIAFCASLIFIAGCKKDKDEEIAITLDNLAGDYKFSTYTFSYKGVTRNLMDSFSTCERDDVMALKADKTYTWTDAGVRCTPSVTYSPQKWDLISTKKILWEGEVYDLDKYDEKVLGLSQTFADSVGNLAIWNIALQKQ